MSDNTSAANACLLTRLSRRQVNLVRRRYNALSTTFPDDTDSDEEDWREVTVDVDVRVEVDFGWGNWQARRQRQISLT